MAICLKSDQHMFVVNKQLYQKKPVSKAIIFFFFLNGLRCLKKIFKAAVKRQSV